MSPKRFLLLAGLTAFAMTAAAASPGVTLVAPRTGEQLDGGSEATLMWSAASLPAGVDEWEAFLSLDGGAYYAVRVTPHLDAGVRTFRWRVPNVAASQARILLRFGDERREHVVELPQAFTIVPRYSAQALDSLLAVPAGGAGEAAIAGGAPSVEWVSSDLVRHRHDDAAASGVPAFAASVPPEDVAVSSSAISLPVDRASVAALFTRRTPPRRVARDSSRPLLLLLTRLNV